MAFEAPTPLCSRALLSRVQTALSNIVDCTLLYRSDDTAGVVCKSGARAQILAQTLTVHPGQVLHADLVACYQPFDTIGSSACREKRA